MVRDAALDCLQEVYRVLGEPLLDNLKRQSIRPASLREVVARLDAIAPTNMCVPDVAVAVTVAGGTAGRVKGSKDMGSVGYTSSGGYSEGDVTAQVDVNPPQASTQQPRKGVVGAARPGGFRDVSVGAAYSNAPAPASSVSGDEAAPSVYVGSERELTAELEAASTVLASLAADWQVRVAAIARVEGVVRGSPALHDLMPEALRVLRGPMTAQLEDRRSAVSKQACKSLSSITGLLGLRFQDHVVNFLPVLFKVLPITVQVSEHLLSSLAAQG
jgi:hypothetical protein